MVKAAALLTNEKGRKTAGWIMAAVFSPLILIAALLCSAASGGAEHNHLAVESSFYGTSFTDAVPVEFQSHISEMRTAFTRLDAAVMESSTQIADGGLDPIQVKAVFYALCFGEEAPSRREANRFVQCFCRAETRTHIVETTAEDGTVTASEEIYTALLPVSLDTAYANLAVLLSREITAEDRDNAAHIYTMIAGDALGSSYDGSLPTAVRLRTAAAVQWRLTLLISPIPPQRTPMTWQPMLSRLGRTAGAICGERMAAS